MATRATVHPLQPGARDKNLEAMKLSAASRVILAVLTFATLAMTESAIAAPASVFVECTGEDIVGSRLCFAVKEAVRRSAAFKLTSNQAAEYNIYMVSHDDSDSTNGESGRKPAVAVTYEQVCFAVPLALVSVVYVVGSKRVADIADAVLADLDSAGNTPLCQTLTAAFDSAVAEAVHTA